MADVPLDKDDWEISTAAFVIMPEDAKSEELRRKLAPFMERGEPDDCADEAAREAAEIGMGAQEFQVHEITSYCN